MFSGLGVSNVFSTQYFQRTVGLLGLDPILSPGKSVNGRNITCLFGRIRITEKLHFTFIPETHVTDSQNFHRESFRSVTREHHNEHIRTSQYDLSSELIGGAPGWFSPRGCDSSSPSCAFMPHIGRGAYLHNQQKTHTEENWSRFVEGLRVYLLL